MNQRFLLILPLLLLSLNAQDLPAEFKEFRVGFLINPCFGMTIYL